jgi:hypothetical protein
MKLPKDQFKRSEVDTAATKIMNILSDYVEQHNLPMMKSNCGKVVYLSTTNIHSVSDSVHDFKEFVKNEFTLFKPDTMSPSHTIMLNENDKLNFYISALEKLNDFEKIVLIKTTKNFKPSLKRLLNTNVFSDNDYWLHLRHVAPFSKIKESAYTSEVSEILTTLVEKSIDTQEKIDSLAYFLNHYKTIVRRTDIKASMVRLLKNKLNEEDFPIFESILATKISNNNTEIDIFLPPPEIKTLIISKSSIFEQVVFDQIPQANIKNYNKYLQSINYFLLSPKVRDELNIARIDFHEFHSNNEPARIYISSESGGFKENIEPIYKHLIQSCASSYSNYTLYNADIESDIGSALKTSLDYFLLHKSIHEANTNTEHVVETKRKNMKI